MALNTQSIPLEAQKKSNHEGYTFVKDEHGRIALKKIRETVKVEEVTETIEVTATPIRKSKKSKK